MTNLSATQESYSNPSELTWSRPEKTVARTAFDAALKRELHEVMQQAKQMARQVNEPPGLVELGTLSDPAP